MRRLISVFMFWISLGVLADSAQADGKKKIFGVFYENCERTCQGFKAALVESGFDAKVIVHEIAQDKSRLPKLVEQARAVKADLVLTWGTSVTLGMLGTLDNAGDVRFIQNIPVVFTLVADPFGTRIAKSFKESGRAHVTGTFNRVPEAVNIEVIRRYDPKFRKLGLLFHRNEANSVIKYEELKRLAPKLGVELVAIEIDPQNTGVPDPKKIPLRMAELRKKGVKWMYVGSSSFLRVHGAAFTATAISNGIAIASPYESLVRKQQALLSIAADRYDVGRLAAQQALKILRDGAIPGDLPIVRATGFAYVVNMEVAKKLGRFPPFEFLQVAETVKK